MRGFAGVKMADFRGFHAPLSVVVGVFLWFAQLECSINGCQMLECGRCSDGELLPFHVGSNMLNAKLVVVGGDAKAKEVSLNLPTVIGRGKDVTLTLPHALVSRQHSEIFEKDGWLFVKDLGSLNGTYVNNRRIKEAQKLPPNHLLTLGNVTFRAVYEAPLSTAATGATGAATVTDRNEDETINFEEIAGEIAEEEVDEAPFDKRDTLRESKDEAAPESDPVALAAKADDASPEKPVVESAAEKRSKNSSDEFGDSGELPEVPGLRKDTPTESTPDSSSIFSGDEEFITPEKSISVSALEGLPSQATPASMSLIGNQLQDIAGPKKQAVGSIELDVPEKVSPAALSDSDLGSFLKKMPR